LPLPRTLRGLRLCISLLVASAGIGIWLRRALAFGCRRHGRGGPCFLQLSPALVYQLFHILSGDAANGFEFALEGQQRFLHREVA
jgi:hypothetical protein